jgi:magnesium-transporting ATPase (P-type)
MPSETGTWRNCSSCKKPIPFRATYWKCNVSTCNRKNTSFVFCSVPCWDAHVPTERHRQAWAEECRSPSSEGEEIMEDTATTEKEVLVVASKVKAYIRSTSEMNTSASTLTALSDCLRTLADRAIENARKEGRKTVMDRDIPPLP